MPATPPSRLSSKWSMPLSCVFLGALVLGAQWLGGDPGGGAVSFAIMAGLGAVILLGGRSETIRGLRGDGRDERFSMIDLRATAASGVAIMAVLIGAWLANLARGGDGDPYSPIMAVGGVAYVVALVWLRWRS